MNALFNVNARPLRSYLMRLTRGQEEAADDLLQETMMRAWRKLEELPVDGESLRRWLFTVARHLVIDAARAKLARATEVQGKDLTSVHDTSREMDSLLDRQLLRDALLQLSAEQRKVLVALYYTDASVAEVAQTIGVPEGTVRSRSFYALRNVRDILSRQQPN